MNQRLRRVLTSVLSRGDDCGSSALDDRRHDGRRRMAAGLGAGLVLAALGATPPARAQSRPARPTPSTPVTESYGNRAEVRAFIDEMVERNGLDRAELTRAFARMQRLDRVVDLVSAPARPGARKVWAEYRGRFVEPTRINEGAVFWQRHATAIKLASVLYGVPQAIIVAIIGVETFYGRHTGDFRVAETLATLAFDYPPRADYFRGELEQFLLHAHDNGLSILDARGSYAGAMGLGQFMPTSIRRWAVDLDRDGRIDLSASVADAAGSIAHFLHEHGWNEGQATHYGTVIADPTAVADIVAAGPKPTLTIDQLFDRGIRAAEEVPVAEKLVLVDLPEGDAPTRYVLGTDNFYAITRYNRSYFYAMSVIELAQAIRARLEGPAVDGGDAAAHDERRGRRTGPVATAR